MKNNNKLALNTILVRKAQKKRATEQDKPKKSKRWFSRFFALMGCLLLVSALALPCFADWNPFNDKIVLNADFELYYMDTYQRIPISLYGFYEISFTSLDYSYSANNSTQLIDGSLVTVYYAFIDGTDAGRLYEVASVSYDGGHYADGILVFNTYADSEHNRIIDVALDISRVVVYVSSYPNNAMNEEAFSSPNTQYSVSKLVAPFEPDKVTSVWTDVMTWITNALASIQSVFYLNGSLTFLGTLAVIGLAIAIGWLIVGVVSRFLYLRG